MNTVVVLGTQWGDEGKGKITDYLAAQADVIVRYQGGSNAGHTVVVDEQEFKLHLVPSGILYPDKTCIIGNGVVVDLQVLAKELEYLSARGVDVTSLKISDRAHIVLPHHRLLDGLQEVDRGQPLGTTKQGIGPAYMDKASRTGLRMIDFLDQDRFICKLREGITEANRLLELVYGCDPLATETTINTLISLRDTISPLISDTIEDLDIAIRDGRTILLEGAQGTLLDLDFGTYPFVTSSHPTAGGACIGSGVGPTRIDGVIGVTKAYTSRVGDGPFPTEEKGTIGDWLRDSGAEFGVTTNRPRRCGWPDTVILRYAATVSGLSGLALTRLDILSGLEQIPICTHYCCDGERVTAFPADIARLARCKPQYETLPGWKEDLTTARSIDELPVNARRYIDAIERLTGVPVFLVSIGRRREDTIAVRPIF